VIIDYAALPAAFYMIIGLDEFVRRLSFPFAKKELQKTCFLSCMFDGHAYKLTRFIQVDITPPTPITSSSD
jgi:hypothetical protein